MRLVEELLNQRNKHMSAGLYYWTQILFSYNSNHIEGTRLSADQTQQIFDSGTVFANAQDDPIKLDDLIETKNHFRAFDWLLDHVDEPLSPDLVLQLHRILKNGTSQVDDPRYNVGGFKVEPNEIGLINAVATTPPEEVGKALRTLFSEWEAQSPTDRGDLVALAHCHFAFEAIHPFSDGNGRVGRLLIFKECCRVGVTPLIIRDENRAYYLRGLKEYTRTPGYLEDTLGFEQDYYQSLVDKFLPDLK